LSSNVEEQQLVRKYLLGILPPDRLAQLEERLLSENELYEELLIAEDELIDQYLSNQLSNSERATFELHFLVTPERQQKIRFARTLKRYVSAAEPKNIAAAASPESPLRIFARLFSFLQNPIVAPSLVAVVLLLVFGSSLVFWSRRAPTQPHIESGNVLRVGLTLDTMPFVREGGEMKKISIPRGIETVQLKLQLPAVNYAAYRAVLLASESSYGWSRENLQPETLGGEKFLSMDLPSESLKRDDYQIKVSGSQGGNYEEIGRYRFRVVE
jgi:hypothetical protein